MKPTQIKEKRQEGGIYSIQREDFMRRTR